MLHRRALPFALLFTLIAVGPLGAQSPEIESLRTKAEKGNSIAQYNLGLAYQAGRDVNVDWPEAFVWLTLAAENGTTGKALQNLVAVMTPTQLAEGQRRLTALRGASTAPAVDTTPTVTPVVAATNADDPQKRLSAELALAWQESDQLKERLEAATSARDRATTELAASTRELATLRASVAKLQSEQASANDSKLDELQREVERLKSIATQMGAHNQELEDAAALRGRTLEETRNELTQAKARVTELTGTLAQLQKTNEDSAAARATAAANLAATRQDLTSAQNAQAAAARELQQARTSVVNLQQSLERTKSDFANLQQQLAATRSELSSGADEISALRTTVANLQDSKSAESNQQIATLQGELKRVKSEAAALGQRNQQLEDTAAERGRLLEAGRKDLDQAEARIEELALNLRQIRDGRDDTSSELTATTTALNAARQELTAAQGAQSATALELQTARNAATQQQHQLAALQSDVSTLREKLAAAQSAQSSGADQLVRLGDELAATKSELAQAKELTAAQADQLSAAQNELAAGADELATLRVNVAKLQSTQKTKGNQQVASLQAELDRVKSDAQALGARQQELEDTAAERGRQLALAQTNLDLANEQIDQLKQTEVKLQKELAAMSKPVEPDPALTQQITQLEAELKMAQQATATAQSQAAQQQSRADQQAEQLNRLRGELAARNNQIRSNDERIAALQNELTAAQTTSNQPNPDAAVIAKLRTEITALNTSLADMQTGRSELTAQVDSLSSDLGSARVQVAGLKSDNENLSRQLATATRPVTSDPADAAKITSLQSDLARVRQQLADAKTAGSMAEEQSATLGNLRDEVARLQTELKQTSAARNDSEAQAQTLAAELAEAKDKLTETKTLLVATASTPAAEDDDTELGALQSKLSTALNSYTILQDENDSLKTTTDQLTMRINQLEGQLAIANNATEDLSTQLDTTSANAVRAAALREQLRQTSDQLGTSRREAAELRTRIAIITPPPSSNYAAPTRPGSAAAATVIAEAVPPAPVAISTARTHKVVSGDTLSGIALRYYGTPVRWAEIYEANRAKLPNERALRIGMELVIP